MLQVQTIFRVTDNSGARKAKCIKVLGGFKKKYAKIGNLIVVSIRDVKLQKKKKIKIKEGDVVHAVIVRTKAKACRLNFSSYLLKENAVVILTNKKKPIATRVKGSVPFELRYTKFLKVALLASGFI